MKPLLIERKYDVIKETVRQIFTKGKKKCCEGVVIVRRGREW